eukprot:CAMPEP_0197440558 /NCGR_PEP_ID=MMETSP1175-20131217/7034_1 /TAXON_ID=1003142 /ORGANISM="Triceratium dubium, Strain CCMP147" /LENGTH=48 /DNA_ID= /DNA_START= /DNA_END= /DNA_ORIENTATION=
MDSNDWTSSPTPIMTGDIIQGLYDVIKGRGNIATAFHRGIKGKHYLRD